MRILQILLSMKYFVLVLFFTGLTGLILPHAFGICIVNTDWPDAPCIDLVIDHKYPQDLVDGWAKYYDYKGAEFMESKKIEMNNAIENGQLFKWVEKSIQNHNVWQYYYFSGQAPNTYPLNFDFDPIPQHVDNETVIVSSNNTSEKDEYVSASEGLPEFLILVIILIAIIVSVIMTVLLVKRK